MQSQNRKKRQIGNYNAPVPVTVDMNIKVPVKLKLAATHKTYRYSL